MNISLLFFLLMSGILLSTLNTVKAEEHGAWNELSFEVPTIVYPANVDVCHEILQIGDYKLCITDDGQMVLVVTSSIGLVAIPAKKIWRKKNEKND